jgi:hypothetical protein
MAAITPCVLHSLDAQVKFLQRACGAVGGPSVTRLNATYDSRNNSECQGAAQVHYFEARYVFFRFSSVIELVFDPFPIIPADPSCEKRRNKT